MAEDPRLRQWSDAIRDLVGAATDEQLAGMTGPDRRFYSDDAIAAAEREIAGRRESETPGTDRPVFNVGAMALGPFWYVYNGMVGRGVLLAAIFVAAALGLQPVARAVGVPASLWVLLVAVVLAVYCGRFGERDLAESRAQARVVRGGRVREAREEEEPATGGPQLAVVAQVGCRAAAEHARTLLERRGVVTLVTPSTQGEEGSTTRLLVPKDDLLKARALIESFLSSAAADCSE